jgi:hypothetical protein
VGDEVETLAKDIYTAMCWAVKVTPIDENPPYWQDCGNSFAQNLARKVAKDALSGRKADAAHPSAPVGDEVERVKEALLAEHSNESTVEGCAPRADYLKGLDFALSQTERTVRHAFVEGFQGGMADVQEDWALRGPNFYWERSKAKAAISAMQPAAVREWMPREYLCISEFYGDRVAERSRVRLMNHIDEGITILKQLGADDMVKRAFCLHPIVQNDEQVDVSWSDALPLAHEYKEVANAYLCCPENDDIQTPEQVFQKVGIMSDGCRLMLLADKIQNQKDFGLHHLGVHARSSQLSRYFSLWIEALNTAYTAPGQTSEGGE